MPLPVALGNGVYHLNIRVPSDLADKARGSTVTLPVEGRATTVRIGDKVASLRTKAPAVAKVRFAEAERALTHFWSAIRSGPVTLLRKQVFALAGDVYRRWVHLYETSPDMTPEGFAADMRRMDADVEAWRFDPSVGTSAISPEQAEILARLARPNGPYLLAFELNRDIDIHGVSTTLEDAEEVLFGSDADRVCAERSLIIGESTRRSLLCEVAKAVRFAAHKHLRAMEGDYGPDPYASRFPAFEAPPPASSKEPAKAHRVETVGSLFERWKIYAADKISASTIRRYGPSLNSLDRWAAGRDWRSLTDEDIFAWATFRRDPDNIAATTVNRNDIVAVSSVLSWPTTREGGKRATVNPAVGVRLREAKKVVTRERAFRISEIKDILHLARSVRTDKRYPRASASRRWCPWICA